jgi:hypothetical protein
MDEQRLPLLDVMPVNDPILLGVDADANGLGKIGV